MALVVGLDLGRKSAHDAAIYRRETGRQVNRGFRVLSTCEGFDKLFEHVRQVREPEEEVAFVIDSPGRAWIPVATVISNRGFEVYRPMATLVVSMRRGIHRKNKTNRIDAKALAKCLLNYPEEVNKVFLPPGSQSKLDQTVRRRDRLVDAIRRRKQRIQDFTEAINPRLMVAMAAFYHKRRRAGHNHTQAVCAVANAKRDTTYPSHDKGHRRGARDKQGNPAIHPP